MSENIKKDIHHIHDKSYKDLYSKKEIAVDLFKSLVDKEWTKYLVVENLTLVNKSYITADYEELESDIVYKANINNTEVYFYILLEFQSTVDYRMPLRLLFYMCEILREHTVNAKHKKYDKNIKIPAVIPIVLYNGEEKWEVPKEFRKMIYNEELFGSNILNFTYDVFDISNDEKFNKENLVISQNVTSAIFLLDQKVDALEFLERIKVIALYFNSLSETEIKAIKNWIKNTVVKELADSAIKILEADKMEVELMVARNAFILEDMKDKAKEEGKAEGRAEGRAEARKELAIKLLDILDDEIISEKTGLDIETVKELRKLNH
ncbi:Rpn family recombination-promoting nuclease/putative transposase [Clostridium sp. DSM 100503]|uniref:Rpn family recombination-promoting nuclease/putative transposase n=1 Tax=Clostridium sp. DSM 100503 TaxID=2963282 RepID=UPI00214A09C5|nr:Rpn family recombination-promoting nuclease/putative transposase [Clostridium sp. DSM 100503]MCR1951624.1 Rpn family recombination-promoting nuclease/putative transposase [Clostridium sp. DSM 100503]